MHWKILIFISFCNVLRTRPSKEDAAALAVKQRTRVSVKIGCGFSLYGKAKLVAGNLLQPGTGSTL